MNILNGIQNFLEYVNQNWTTIAVCIGLIIAIVNKAKTYFAKSDDEKIAIAKGHIKQAMLKMVTEAELDYSEWNQAGSIKRSQVIEEIFEKYPILSKAIKQDELIAWIDEEIDNSLKTLREVIDNNKPIENIVTE